MVVRRSRFLIALAVTAVLVGSLMTAAGASSRVHHAPARVTKTVKGIGAGHWSPTVTRVSSGGTIVWKAISNSHTVTAYGGNWRFNHSLPFGANVTHRFAQPGTYLFRCRFHSSLVNGHCEGMCGKVVVTSA